MEDNVYDLVEWRARLRPAPLPTQVRAEIELADRLYDALAAQGFELPFEGGDADGDPVRAELRATDGEVVRRVSLYEAVGADGPDDCGGPGPAAA